MSEVAVIGAGAWGSALAQAAAMAGRSVILLGRDQSVADEINIFHTNVKYLGEQDLQKTIIGTCEAQDIKGADLVILAVPAQITRQVLQELSLAVKTNVPVILTAKGFERHSLALQTDILASEWPEAKALVLSGPSFAVDVAGGKPTAVTLAGDNASVLQAAASLLSSKVLRPYLSDDPKGVSLCGGLKNIYALGSGAIEGAGLGLSARSAFVARALAEMGRLVGAIGGKPASVFGLAGVGDLMLSCTSEQSRNYRFGIQLGRGKSAEQIVALGVGLAEGVASASAALAMAKGAKIDAPLVQSVNDLLNGKKSVAQIVTYLMQRELKIEGA